MKKYSKSTWGGKIGRKKGDGKSSQSKDSYKGHKEAFYFLIKKLKIKIKK